MYSLNLVLKLLYIYVYQREAEAGSAEEQPARNTAVTDEVIHNWVWHLPGPFLCNYFRGLYASKTYTTYTIGASFFL